MKLHKAKQIINEGKQPINEFVDPFIAIPIGVLFLMLYVIPMIQIIIYNYVHTYFGHNVKDDKLTAEIQKISGQKVEVYISDANMINAWHAGTKKIFITKNLMKLLNEREIMAILLHETGHYVNVDMLKDTFLYTPILKLVIIAAMLPILFVAPELSRIIFYLLFGGADALKARIMGKKMEYLADSYAAEHGYGDDLISALEKLWVTLKKQVCKKIENTPACELKLEKLHTWDAHPDLTKRKINIKMPHTKYTGDVLNNDGTKDIKPLAKKSYFELAAIMKELKKALQEESERTKKVRDELKKSEKDAKLVNG